MAINPEITTIKWKQNLLNKKLSQLGVKQNTYGLDPIVTLEWAVMIYGDGNVDGGYIWFNLDFKTLSSELYYAINTILLRNVGVEAFRLTTNTDQWDNLNFPGVVDEPINFYSTSGGAFESPDYQNMLTRMIYLGKPTGDANGGETEGRWAVNNNGESYNCFMHGFAFSEPLPLVQMYRPLLF